MTRFILTVICLATAGLIPPTASWSDQIATFWALPIDMDNRRALDHVKLTDIGGFGVQRKARPGLPAHLHTGVDIQLPNSDHLRPVFPVANGRVISLRDDGPFAQIIIEHRLANGTRLWSVYEHIAGIQTKIDAAVDPSHPIARFMTNNELDRYGLQFNHLHFELLKATPKPREPEKIRPFLYFSTYTIECYSLEDLHSNYESPFSFLTQKWNEE